MEKQKQCEVYKSFIIQMLEEITSLQDLKRIYTLVSVKHENYK